MEKLSTQDKAMVAIRKMAARGEWPSIEAVRDELGTGSNSTIQKVMNDWKKRVLALDSGQGSATPPWSEDLVLIFEKVYSIIFAYAQSQFSQVRAQLEANLATATAALEHMRAAEQDALNTAQQEREQRLAVNQVVDDLRQTLDREIHDREHAETALVALQQESQQERQHADALIAGLQSRMTEAQDKFSQETEKVRLDAKIQVERAYERLEGLRETLMAETNRERERVRKEVGEIERRLANAEGELKQKQSVFNQQLAERDRCNARLDANIQMLERQLADSQESQRLQQLRLEKMIGKLATLTALASSSASSEVDIKNHADSFLTWLDTIFDREGVTALATFDVVVEISEDPKMSAVADATGLPRLEAIGYLIRASSGDRYAIHNDQVHRVEIKE